MKIDQKLRYKVIEIVSFWEQRLTTNHLCAAFGIGRQQASKDINDYLAAKPDNLVYDPQLKGYKPSPKFKPYFTRCEINEYIQLITALDEALDPFLDISLLEPNLNPVAIETATLPAKPISPEILIPLLEAIRAEKSISIAYVSLTSPKPELRTLEPHTLVFTGSRWHTRAFCGRNKEFRDFVLTRFRGKLTILGDASASKAQDHYWQHKVKVKIIPDTRLDAWQRKIIAQDYGMIRNSLIIETRAALVTYLLQQYKIDPNKIEARPEAQQLMIANLSEVEKWLF